MFVFVYPLFFNSELRTWSLLKKISKKREREKFSSYWNLWSEDKKVYAERKGVSRLHIYSCVWNKNFIL